MTRIFAAILDSYEEVGGDVMRVLIQKFGGTSLATNEARGRVVDHIVRERREGYDLVVVVSAMGRLGDPYSTDTLLDWIHLNDGRLPQREQDLLLSCGEVIAAATLCSLLQERGIPATVLTGGQAGIITDWQFGSARIIDMRPQQMIEHLSQHRVVIVTGYQGITEDGEITTLGRGGSDTTAAAIGAALQAESVDIYTDVEGVLTADPRHVADAKRLSVVSYSEICNMAYHGAKVIHPRAVEIAMQSKIPIRVRSTFSSDTGTLVTSIESGKNEWSDRHVTGIAYVDGISQIRVDADEGQYDLQLNVFQTMAQHQISIDFININPSGALFTVFDQEVDKTVSVLKNEGYNPKILRNCAKVSIIGGGMNGVPGIMARIVEALTEEDIHLLQSSDSNTTIWVLVDGKDLNKSLRALHTKFELFR